MLFAKLALIMFGKAYYGAFMYSIFIQRTVYKTKRKLREAARV